MYNTQYFKVYYLEGKNAILCEAKKFCKGDNYRNPFLYGAKLVREYNPNIWITDTTYGFKNEKEDTIWLLEEFIPKMIKSSIDKIIFIINKESKILDEIKSQKKVLELHFNVELVESMEDIS